MSSRPLPEPPSPSRHNQSHHHPHQQGQQNGYVSSGRTKSPDHMTNHMTNGTHHMAKNGRTDHGSTTSSGGDTLPDVEPALLTEDIFYNFGNLAQGIGGPMSPGMFDPNDPSSIPFSDIPTVQGEEFDQELFDSILSSGNDILARLDSTPSVSLTTDEGGGANQISATPSDGSTHHDDGMYICTCVCLCVGNAKGSHCIKVVHEFHLHLRKCHV